MSSRPSSNLPLVVHEHRRLYRAAVLTQRLERTDALAQIVEPFDSVARRAGQDFEIRQCLLHRFNTAQARNRWCQPFADAAA